MLWSVHDHPDGRNRARSGQPGGVQGGGGLHVDGDGPLRPQPGPLSTAHHVVAAGERAGVHGAPRHRAGHRRGQYSRPRRNG